MISSKGDLENGQSEPTCATETPNLIIKTDGRVTLCASSNSHFTWTDSWCNSHHLLRAGIILATTIALGASVSAFVVLTNQLTLGTCNGSPADGDSVCLDCLMLLPDPTGDVPNDPMFDQLTITRKNGTLECCASTKAQLSSLLHLTMKRQRNISASLTTIDDSALKFTPVSAHKALLPYTDRPSTRDQYLALAGFDPNHDPKTEHVRGVKVKDASLVIQVSGLYYVYMSFDFKSERPDMCKGSSVTQWIMRMYRLSPNRPDLSGILLTSLHTCCQSCPEDEETSFSAGTFHLRAGDHLQIQIPNPDVVSFTRQSSYTGLILLASL